MSAPDAPAGPGHRPNLEVFAETLAELARGDPRLTVVTSDSRGSGRLSGFARAFPAQMVEVGIAEQNLVGVAAGLASTGRPVVAVSPACFLTARALEQIKNDVCYSEFPVVLVGISAGVSYGALGSTHHSLHDLAALRALPDLTVMVPADALETAECLRHAVSARRPAYLRFGKFPVPALHPPGTRLPPGRALRLREGAAATVLACGECVAPACAAADRWAARGTPVGVLSVPTVHPLDTAAVRTAAPPGGAVLTVEEHGLAGGLGEACAAVLLEAGWCGRFRRLGLPVSDTWPDRQAGIFAHHGIDADGIDAALGLLLA